MSPLISIVIPCYNAARYIRKTLQSVFSQTYSDFEVLLVDDGSTDGSEELIKTLNHPALQYLRQTNQGVSSARNKGLALAKGKYILFLDADDLLEPDFLKSRLNLLESKEEILFSYSDVITVDEEDRKMGKVLTAVGADIEREVCTYAANHCSCPSNYLIRRTAFTGKLFFNPLLSNSADRFFLLQLNQIGVGEKVSGDCRLLYRIHEGSMSKNIQPKNIRDLILFYQEVIGKQLVPSKYYWQLKLKTFRICFSESLLIRNLSLTFRCVLFILLKR